MFVAAGFAAGRRAGWSGSFSLQPSHLRVPYGTLLPIAAAVALPLGWPVGTLDVEGARYCRMKP